MNFRLKDCNLTTDGRPNDSKNDCQGLELDTPYFRRSMAQKDNVALYVIELRVDKFLEENGITYVKLDEEYDDVAVAKNLNFFSSPSINKRTSVSERQDDSSRSSFSSFNLDNNTLFLRRKTSTNPPPFSPLKESS